MKEEYIVTEIHDRCASNSNGDEIYWAKVRKVKKVEHKCCDGECNHDDCCGKISENCPLLSPPQQ